MAKSSRNNIPSNKPSASDWAALTWDDLENSFDSRSVERGRSYQHGGRVRKLCISSGGELLATVNGTYPYATTVALLPDAGQPSFESNCTCPIGGHCKHVVAVIAEYLAALAKSQPVPTAAEDDPRWDELESEPGERGGYHDSPFEEEGYWEERDEGEEWGEEEQTLPRARRAKAPGKQPASAGVDKQIDEDIRSRPQTELADLVCSLVRRFPELRQEFRERISLQKGNVKQLSAEAREQIREVTADPGWSDHWSHGGHTPDYAPIRHRLERMFELGHADEVVSLGRELIEKGLEQISQSDDEGETAEAFRECLPVVFRALERSRLSGSERLLFVIDAMLADDYDTFTDVGDAILDAGTPQDWSAVADTLARRLPAQATPSLDREDFSRNYERDHVTRWLGTALVEAGREAELRPLYEREARITGSYERLVSFLLEQGRADDAERWAKEGIIATREEWPGIASHLAGHLRKLAEQREQWDVVAAHAADDFFDQPHTSTFNTLMEAARKAGVEGAVREAALRFLESGKMPYRLREVGREPSGARAKSGGKKSTAKNRPPAAPPTEPELVIDKKWPLPIPDYLRPVPKPKNAFDPGERPHLHVLLQLAIDANKPEEVLHWFDKMRAEKGASYYASDFTERVASAVAATHPERAMEIYRARLNAQLPHSDKNAYAQATNCLRKMRPIYDSLGRPDEWTALVASIREQYKRRRLFMEQLDTLEGETIVESLRKSRK